MQQATNRATHVAANIAAVENPPKRLGERLIEYGLITPDQLEIALLEQKVSGDQLGEILISLGFATDEVIRGNLKLFRSLMTHLPIDWN